MIDENTTDKPDNVGDTVNDPDPSQIPDPPQNPDGIDELVEKDETNADPDTPKTAVEAEQDEARDSED